MPPKFSANELKRRSSVRAAYFAGKPKPAPEPVPVKRLKPVEPSLVSIPAPTSSVIEELPPSVSIETVEAWASADAKAHVYQASQNSTRPLGSKTTNPLPDKLPAQRKYFDQLGFVIRSERFQLSLAQNAEYVRFYREYLVYWKEIQASKPVQSKVDNLQKLPVKMGKVRIPEEKRTISTSVKYFYEETETRVFETPELRQQYVDDPANSCYTLQEDGSKKYTGIFRDTLPVIVDKIDPAQSKIYMTIEKLDKDRHTKTVDLKGVKLENTVDMQQHTPEVICAYHALKGE